MSNYEHLRKIAKKQFNINVNLENYSTKSISLMLESIKTKKKDIILKEEFNSYSSNPDYAKLIIIEGMIKMFLREIAPKRRFKRTKRNAKKKN